MKLFNAAYDKIVTEIAVHEHLPERSSIPTHEFGMIYEDCAFHKLPRMFADILIEEIKRMKQTKIIESPFDVRAALKTINKNEVENFQEFYDFIQLLVNSSPKILTLKLGTENSFTEPVALYEFADEQYLNVLHNSPYEDMLKSEIKGKKLSASLKIMQKFIDDIDDVGTLTINPMTIEPDNFEYDNDDTIIGHEIRHFIIFLQRWSKANYHICRTYSSKDDDYDKNMPDFKKYSLHNDEFITASSTYIERLVNMFTKNRRMTDIKEANLLIKSVLAKGGCIPISELNRDYFWMKQLNTDSREIRSVIAFFRSIYDDISNGNGKLRTLMRWALKTFQEKLDELKKDNE